MDEDHYLQAAAPLSQLRQPQQQAAACLYFQICTSKDASVDPLCSIVTLISESFDFNDDESVFQPDPVGN